MKNNKINEKGIHQLYQEDAELADKLVWNGSVDPASRRGFLRKSGLLAMSTALGATIPFADKMPGGLIPAALANTDQPFKIAGKDKGLIILNDSPLAAETPAHLLDDPITPADKIFVRNNGIPPVKIDLANWVLQIEGESIESPMQFSLAELKKLFVTTQRNDKQHLVPILCFTKPTHRRAVKHEFPWRPRELEKYAEKIQNNITLCDCECHHTKNQMIRNEDSIIYESSPRFFPPRPSNRRIVGYATIAIKKKVDKKDKSRLIIL